VNQCELEVWQRPARNRYFQPSSTTYYETTRRRKYSVGAIVAGCVGALGGDGILGWAAWSTHQASIHGNTHSLIAEAVVAAASATSAVLAAFGFASKTERGATAGTILTPASLVIDGFGVLLWAPGWPASAVITLMEGVFTGGVAAVMVRFGREERRFNHEAGMQHDRIAGDLQKNYDTQTSKTERTYLKYSAWLHTDRRVDQTVYELHLRHPGVVSAPERYAPTELAAAPTRLAITARREPADDWMALADVVADNVENR